SPDSKTPRFIRPHPFLSFNAPQLVELNNSDSYLLKGDNLEALSTLSINFLGRIDFCYIDPPYNTGSKFIYHDKRHSTEKGIWGKHSEWMSFMLPRLVLLYSLLSESGIATISIDDYEYAQLKILLDHVFGEDNHLGTIVVNRSKNGKGSKPHIATNHEYVLVDRKSTRLNSSHVKISYAVFCLKKKIRKIIILVKIVHEI